MKKESFANTIKNSMPVPVLPISFKEQILLNTPSLYLVDEAMLIANLMRQSCCCYRDSTRVGGISRVLWHSTPIGRFYNYYLS